MTEPVTLHNSYYLIDTKAWLDLRTGAHHAEHSSQLQDFVRCNVFDGYRAAMDPLPGCSCGAPCTASRSVMAPDRARRHCLTKPIHRPDHIAATRRACRPA